MSDFKGKFFVPSDENFVEEAFSRAFNKRRPTDRLPSAVLRAADVDDVIAGVKWAKANNLAVTVRSGGHSWAAWSIQNDTLLIDLEHLHNAGYDEATGIAWAEPAIQGGNVLDPFLAERGRFFNGGHCPPVGVGGFLLQGGQGWCQRGWGWAAESVVGVDVVTAEGELIHADANENSDLYWAARGAGPSFPGIVVKFYLKTRPRFGYVGHNVQIYDMADFDEVMEWMYHADKNLIGPDVEIVCVSLTPPSMNGEPRKRVLAVTGLALVDSKEAADEALAPFQQCPAIERALVNEPNEATSLAERRADQIRMNPEDHRWYTDNVWVDGDPKEVVKRIRPLFADIPEEEPEAFAIWFGNGLMRPLPDMALDMQTPAYVASYFVYKDAANDVRNREYLNGAMEYAQPVTVGQYLGDSDFTNRQLKFMSDKNFAKLQEIIAKWDADGRFVRYLAKDPANINKNHWQL